MADAPQDPKRINASPTKEFFIYMITRDIPLTRAILDLVDNSVDGARRMRADGNFEGLSVRVELDRDRFKIEDNCGGIPVDVARNYAFRFGRPKEAPVTHGSVGQFGVGMKRTFFKLGRHFKVTSATTSSRFGIDIDVERWKGLDEPEGADAWHFEFSTVEENLLDVPALEIGTHIEIDQLYDPVIESFGLDGFIGRLKQEMSLAHTISMDRGLVISINGILLHHEPQTLFMSEKLHPAHVEKVYERELIDGAQGSPVKAKLFAGVAERSYHDGGWYIFCNGRLVVRADQTATTVWGTNGIRQYHADLAFFRGYVYFDSDDAALLPWTTTKTGVDVDSPVYRNVQQEMIELTKPVLAFLRNLATETAASEAGEIPEQVLNDAIRTATATRTDAVPLRANFSAPAPRPAAPGPKYQKIQYSKPIDEVNKVKALLKVSTFTAVGEKTFEYFMEYEAQ